ncbi:unnamed protein product [Nippostrongylus brasiliensis]|uniref:Uncharacterized protein n=1 Tax=Nippostrongylus brasiliensis TaxID=27835 RepID=A0A158R3M4_NIPBR|nr:unnamed protein product [Nippostrongylus brasiliensis]
MGVETTFPVYEATSSGLLVLSGQLWMFIMYYTFEVTKKMNIIYDFDPKTTAGNWELNLDIWCVLGILAVGLSFLSSPRYKRMEFELSVTEQQQLGSDLSRAYEMTPDCEKSLMNRKTTDDLNGEFQLV